MKKNSFIEGTIIATLAIVVTKILGMLYVIPFYALVGSSGSTLYAYGYNIYMIFLDIGTSGLPLALSKIIKEYSTLEMLDAKKRAFMIALKIISFLSIIIFLILIFLASPIATLILGDLKGGTTIMEVTFVIRCVSVALLIVPMLSITRGYLQGHNILGASSFSQVLEQIFRIITILGGCYIALKVFNLPMMYVIGIAVFGATIGGVVALIYILEKLVKNKKSLGLEKIDKKDNITNKEIGRKIIFYAIPFIIITIAFSINNFLDMVMILRTMEHIGLETWHIEFATTAITTWSTKISMIVNSIATGMVMSLIPTIVGAYTLQKWNEVEDKFNKALQLILLICIPMCLGLSLLSKSVWSIFYGYNPLGAKIFACQILVSLVYNLFLITNSALHGLNKSKVVYQSVIIGLTTNILLNIPLILLFYKIGLEPSLGAILATFIGYSIAFTISLIRLKKDNNIHYTKTINLFRKLLIPSFIMSIIVILLKLIIKVNLYSKISCIIYVSIISVAGALVYLFITYKMGIIEEVFGSNLKNIKKKLTLKG